MHDLSRLGERSFEDLCRALVAAVLSVGVQSYGDGPDGGREATFEGPTGYAGAGGRWHGYGILQAKYRRVGLGTQDTDWLIRQITAELDAWLDPARKRVSAGRRPEYLIIATNVRLTSVPSSGGIDRVHKLLRRYAGQIPLKDFALWDGNTLSMYLDNHPQVRHAYAHLITSGDVLAKTVDSLGRLDEFLSNTAIQVGQGAAPNTARAFEAAYRAAGGAPVLGQPTSDVYEDGPGWVQHFRGAVGGPEMVICARYGHEPVVLDASIWDALRAVSPGQLDHVGYPTPTPGEPLVEASSRSIMVDGGEWGPGRLARDEQGRWRWQPQLSFGFQAHERDRWTLRGELMDLRLRCAVRLFWRGGEDRAIDPEGRKRLRNALSGGSLLAASEELASRLGLPLESRRWERTPSDEGYNDGRFASYRLLAADSTGRTVFGLWARFQLPDGLQPAAVALVDLRIDLVALSELEAADTGREVLELSDVRRFFTAAWVTANHDLPLAAVADPYGQPPAGASVTELHLDAEYANTGDSNRAHDLTRLVDLAELGEPTRQPLAHMSIAVTAPPLSPSQVQQVVDDAIRRMAAGFGFLEPESD